MRFDCIISTYYGGDSIKLNKYTLYLDESLVDKNFFALAGVVIKNDQVDSVDHEVKALKATLWSNLRIHTAESIVLHQMLANQILHGSTQRREKLAKRFGNEYKIFSNRTKYNTLINGVGNIIEKNSLPIIGAAVDAKKVNNLNNLNRPIDSYKIATQIVVENYVNFLVKHEGRGNVIFESRATEDDDKTNLAVQSTFYMIKARGTLLFPEYLVQKHLNNVLFRKKTNNDPGLQIADFVPNNFARKIAGKNTNSIGRILLNRRYDGMISKPEYFGVRFIPYI
ncbi:DUF3800 domain-containing protein [Lactiplantibacillus plantarum]|uniref:DUF3800 domain-containing protein n=1 Tax=Lactiplantibacillus plantarum TaxID=1590 RepID=UPI0008FB01DF|nr:DUF3800 domain-containing protein [Lactiplantibacillus plantarum]MCW6117418.1 DUF3800 domain-containing protein [Lactiplantibacillus plantarum]WNJ67997.1 DUF3800 domain-containing protein [Lactiplantibacillus plantarum]